MIEIRFEIEADRAIAYDTDAEQVVGYCTFERLPHNTDWAITHTVVDPAYGGQGIAGKLVKIVVDEARSIDAKIIPVCSYVQKQFEKKEEYKDMLSSISRDEYL